MDVPNGGNGEESQSAPEWGGPRRLDFYRAPELNCHATLGTTSGGSVTRMLRANIPPKHPRELNGYSASHQLPTEVCGMWDPIRRCA
jgi:hypothetical protein